jgi:hypothetical protein
MVTHSVVLRGLKEINSTRLGTGPTLLQRTDQDPVAGILADLLRDNTLTRVGKTILQPLDNATKNKPAKGIAKFLKAPRPDRLLTAAKKVNLQSFQLYQPVHRVFHLVLLEVVCDPHKAAVPALQPRLDPRKIESAGLVLRRYSLDPESGETLDQLEGWRTFENPPPDLAEAALPETAPPVQLKGWIPFSTSAQQSPDLQQDPDPAKRPAPTAIKVGRAELDRQLSALQAAHKIFSENTAPLFVAPPEVCKALKKTILYGLVPLTSQELGEAVNTQAAFSSEFVKDHLPDFLRATVALANRVTPETIIQVAQQVKSEAFSQRPTNRRQTEISSRPTAFTGKAIGSQPPTMPEQGSKPISKPLSPLEKTLADQLGREIGLRIGADSVRVGLLLLTPAVPRAGELLTGQQIAALQDPQKAANDPEQIAYDALQDYLGMLRQLKFEFEAFSDRNPGKALYNSLNQLTLSFGDKTQPAGEALKEVAERLLDPNSQVAVEMPTTWPVISEDLGEQIAQQVKHILDKRLAISTPQLRRFDELDRTYQLRAFVRVKSDDGCPPKLVWSDPSPDFTIMRWYDNSPAPPVQVALPDLLGDDRSALENLKPNIAFAVPAGLFNQLDGMTLQDLLEGKKPSGGGPALDWICGFNIPIITLCAFIVLNIFLQLLNFIFQWLLFVKICIPFPRSSEGG